MPITNLDLSIRFLKEYTLRMIEKCQDSVDLSVEYMLKKDMKKTKKLIREDDDIDILINLTDNNMYSININAVGDRMKAMNILPR